MNDIMQKRLTGVVILVALAILIALLLTRCAGGGAGSDQQSAMRVYNISPKGQAQPAADGAKPDHTQLGNAQFAEREAGSAPPGIQTDSASGGASDYPEAISPDSGSRPRQTAPEKHGSFTTPPVRGDNSGAQAPNSSAPAPSAASSAQTPPSAASSHSAPIAHTGNEAQQTPSAPSAGAGHSLAHSGQPHSGWAVQVASFSRVNNAQKLARQLKGQFDAYYHPGDVNGKTYYRVFVGPFANKNAAQGAAGRLRQHGRQPLVRHLP